MPSGNPLMNINGIFQGAGIRAKNNRPDQEMATSSKMIFPLPIFFNSEIKRIP